VIDELIGHHTGRRREHDGSAIGARYRHMTQEMQARVVAVIEHYPANMSQATSQAARAGAVGRMRDPLHPWWPAEIAGGRDRYRTCDLCRVNSALRSSLALPERQETAKDRGETAGQRESCRRAGLVILPDRQTCFSILGEAGCCPSAAHESRQLEVDESPTQPLQT